MKIVSPFHDYYDSAGAYGHDDTRVYERTTRELEIPRNVWPYGSDILVALSETAHLYRPRLQSGGFLLFCGEVHPVFFPEDDHPWGAGVAPGTPLILPAWIAYYETLLRSEDRAARAEAEAFFEPDTPRRAMVQYRRYLASRGYGVMDRVEMATMTEAWSRRRLAEDILIGQRAPYATLRTEGEYYNPGERVRLTLNPRLADLGFPKLLDAFACYQAIETFLGNELAPPDLAPQRVGSDEILAAQKGFDDKSFRTAAPGAKKANRDRNRRRKRGEEADDGR